MTPPQDSTSTTAPQQPPAPAVPAGWDPRERGVHGLRRRRRKPEKPRTRLGAFWRRYSLELTSAVTFVVGVFLLVERLAIRRSIYAAILWFFAALRAAAREFIVDLRYLIDALELSDLVGLVLILTAIPMLAVALRRRAIKRHPGPQPPAHLCPRCQHRLHRWPRQTKDRVLARLFLIQIRRYHCLRCGFHLCEWSDRRAARRRRSR